MPPLPANGASHQLPSHMVANEFGEVNVRRRGSILEISFTILMEPSGDLAEGWQTGVALDASASMKSEFGRGLRGGIPSSLLGDYTRRGWVRELEHDGRRVQRFEAAAYQDAIRQGYVVPTENRVEPLARQFISYLADNLDEDGGTTVLYWALDDGRAIEVAGDFTGEQVRSLSFKGPKMHRFGAGTHLLPAMRYFVQRFRDARRGMYLFLTDGRIDDLEDVARYTAELCRAIAAGQHNAVKCVLIGVGDKIDEHQMERLDDLDTGTDVDIWDHKIAQEMRAVVEIFAEVVDENQIVAPTARIFDQTGQVVKVFGDGLPAKTTFQLPLNSSWFELEVSGTRIRQPIV